MKKICTYNNIVHFVFFDLTSKVNDDLDSTLNILFFDSVQERLEPFRRAEVPNDPSKVYLQEVRIVKCLSSESVWTLDVPLKAGQVLSR
jgi:hypothetical protein